MKDRKKFNQTIIGMVSGLCLMSILALGAAAQTPKPAKATSNQPKTTTKATHAPRSDAEIQADIQKRLAAAPKLKSEQINVSVSGGVATFTGMVKNGGSKGAVDQLAKAAGAKSVVNNLTVEKMAKEMKKETKPASTTKKP